MVVGRRPWPIYREPAYRIWNGPAAAGLRPQGV